MTDEQKQKLKDYQKEYYKKYYIEKKLNNHKDVELFRYSSQSFIKF